jgi:heat shock protein HtpX
MSLYTLAESNIRKTRIYLVLFFLLILLIGYFFAYFFQNWTIFWVALILAFLTNFFSYWYSDKIVLALTHAKEIKKRDNPELYRIIENLCITAGLPLPKIYIINESQPNAFATGRNPQNAVIAVTQGLLEKLDRVELEGVLSHELAHIGNRDMLLATIIVVLVGLVVYLTDFFFRISFWRGSSRERKAKNPLLMIVGIILIILAPLLATLIRLAISRKREFLADATGALLTRYPEGLARALEKIAKDQAPLRVANNATAHLYIVNPFRGRERTSWLYRLFSTHPPVEERIAALRGMKV